ncbi:hypothetical protein GQ55_1G269600 [Panicum hallii var. hallii]|uniref:CASP-like protein n=1 Tax=Panicum hallii var. hallii TaxID=1504633 RepID=A0A2T7F7X7_9POAL|nr:hypothetical protein GQ55_1G269600 [Panicum hallii var. hallii]
MALSRRTAWVAGGLGARLLMIAVLAATTRRQYDDDLYKLRSYSYAVAAAVIGMAGGALQVPVAVYSLCRSKRMAPSALVPDAPVAAYLLCRGGGPSAAALDASMYADMAATAALASGVGAGFGATSDARQMVDNLVRWERGGGARGDLDAYYDRGAVALVFLLAGMILSMCASVVSARVRARAGGEEGHILGN